MIEFHVQAIDVVEDDVVAGFQVLAKVVPLHGGEVQREVSFFTRGHAGWVGRGRG